MFYNRKSIRTGCLFTAYLQLVFIPSYLQLKFLHNNNQLIPPHEKN